jgi:hypothetical protein
MEAMMGVSRTLLRKLDIDLIDRLEASGTPEKPKRIARKKKPRMAETYRGARRNARRTFRAKQLALKRGKATP